MLQSPDPEHVHQAEFWYWAYWIEPLWEDEEEDKQLKETAYEDKQLKETA